MTDFSVLLQQGNAWLFIPSAILLGALHGVEPGHSKTMMAAYISGVLIVLVGLYVGWQGIRGLGVLA